MHLEKIRKQKMIYIFSSSHRMWIFWRWQLVSGDVSCSVIHFIVFLLFFTYGTNRSGIHSPKSNRSLSGTYYSEYQTPCPITELWQNSLDLQLTNSCLSFSLNNCLPAWPEVFAQRALQSHMTHPCLPVWLLLYF